MTGRAFAADLQNHWQPPAPRDSAVGEILARAAQTPQAALQGQQPGSLLRRPRLWLAAAASFAAILTVGSMMRPPASVEDGSRPGAGISYADASPLDDDALSYVFSNELQEELL